MDVLSDELEELYSKHEAAYDLVEAQIRYFRLQGKPLSERDVTLLLILIDDAVETHAAYSSEFGKAYFLRWLSPRWLKWRLTREGSRKVKEAKENK